MITINYKDPRPIYEQVRDSLRTLILAGAYAPDEKLPSVRELAGQLSINPNTIQRAYRELESLGFIYTAAGKGAFVASGNAGAMARKGELMNEFANAVRELRLSGAGLDELQEALKAAYESATPAQAAGVASSASPNEASAVSDGKEQR